VNLFLILNCQPIRYPFFAELATFSAVQFNVNPVCTARLLGNHQIHIRNVASVVGMNDRTGQFSARAGDGG